MDSKYIEYLQSDWWKKTRDEAIERAEHKCFCCERPFDLQVHHLTYEHLGFEREYELVVLCKSCHDWIEKHKQASGRTLHPGEQLQILTAHREELESGKRLTVKTRDELMTEFGKAYYRRDYSQLGDLNLTRLEVIKEEFPKFCEENHYAYIKPRWSEIIEFFSCRRYEVILRFKDRGAPMSEVMKQTRIMPNMIRKVWNNPDQYRRMLEMEGTVWNIKSSRSL